MKSATSLAVRNDIRSMQKVVFPLYYIKRKTCHDAGCISADDGPT